MPSVRGIPDNEFPAFPLQARPRQEHSSPDHTDGDTPYKRALLPCDGCEERRPESVLASERRALQHHRVWLGPESLSKKEKEDGRRQRDETFLLFHSCSILYDDHRIITSFRQASHPYQDTPPGIDRCSGRKRSYSEYQRQSDSSNGGREHSFSR